MKRYLQIIIVLGVFVGYFFFSLSNTFAAGNLYLTPSNTTGGMGSNITVSVRTNITSDPVNAIQANLTYPADKLDFVGVNAAASPFNIQAESTGGGGVVRIARGVIGAGLTGDRLVATVTFRVKQNSGTAAISFAGDSAVVSGSSNSNVLSGTTGSNITMSNAKPSPTVTSNPQTTIEISELKVEDITYNSATVTWKTNVDTDSTIEYGLSDKFGLTAHQSTATSSHRLVLDSPLIAPGTTYLFIAKSADNKENETVSEQMSFTTKGYTVVVKVEDPSSNPVANADVTVASPNGPITLKTDSSGQVTFNNLPTGKMVVIIETSSGSKTSTIEVNTPNQEGEEELSHQEFTIQVAGVSDTKFELNKQTLLIIAVPVILLLLGLIVGIIVRISKNNATSETQQDSIQQ